MRRVREWFFEQEPDVRVALVVIAGFTILLVVSAII